MSELFDREALIYRSREKIKSAKYQKGMEDGYILRFYKGNFTVLSGAIICTTLEQAEEESKKSTREKVCLDAENQHIPVVYDKPVPIMITHKYTDEEHKELLDADLLPFSPFIDNNEDEYVFAEITEENCWIIKNLPEERYFTASTEFMQEYELLEDKQEDRTTINIEDITTEEILKSNCLKREACDNIKKALKENLSADDMTIELFERIFWADTQGYLFRKRYD